MSTRTDFNSSNPSNAIFNKVFGEVANVTDAAEISIDQSGQIHKIATDSFQNKTTLTSIIGSNLTILEEKVQNRERTIQIFEGVCNLLTGKKAGLYDQEAKKTAKLIYKNIQQLLQSNDSEEFKIAQQKTLQQQLTLFKTKLIQQNIQLDEQLLQKKPHIQKLDELKQQALREGAPLEEVELIIQRGLTHLQKTQDLKQLKQIEERVSHSINTLIATTKIASDFGNKTANLERLKGIFSDNSDIVIPSFQGISHTEILQFIDSNFLEFQTLWKEFQDHISQNKDLESAAPILSKIQEGIKQAFSSSKDFPNETLIKEFLQSKQKMMVRSTGREDTLKVVNPGGNESVPNVDPSREEIAKAIGTVVASYFSTKSLGQRAASKDDIAQAPFLPVLLQVMVGEEDPFIPISGVMYTTEGGLGTDGVTQISAGFGHADGVVTGFQSNDVYYVQENFTHGIVQNKPTRRVPQKNGKLGTAFNPRHLRNVPCLTEKQLHQLAQMGKKIEENYGYPMDVEWSYDTKTNKFYLFQARPISQQLSPVEPSYVSPERIKELQNIQQVAVIEAGGGAVCELNQDNTFMCHSAKEALDKYLQNPKNPPKAVLIAQPTAPNSHEAGFFRERRIPVIYLPGDRYKNISDSLKSHTVLMDTQEGFSAILPKGKAAKDYISKGLRRHLTPKMESIIHKPASADVYAPLLQQLNEQASKFEQKELKLAFGWNVLDKLLNTFEEVQSPAERAYLLNVVLFLIEKKLLPKVPSDQKEDLRLKILYNIEHVWKVYNEPNTDILNRKFAMNWLRAAILQRPVEGVVHSETLYTALDAIKERKILDLPSLSKEKGKEEQAYLDTFQRSVKFILTPEVRNNWNTFIHHLNSHQMKQLAAVFTQLGPHTVETWINSEFVDAWKNSKSTNEPEKQSAECIQKLVETAQNSHLESTLQLQERAKIVAKQFRDLASDFGDPVQFDKLLPQLESRLLKVMLNCIKKMQTAEGIELTLLAQSFDTLIATFDDCIKGLTGSALYPENEQLKAERFALLLDRYLTVTNAALGTKALKDPVLLQQVKSLLPFLNTRWEELKKIMKKNPKIALLPSSTFSVAMAALGSGIQDPKRAMPNSLEDFFTLLHQSLITASQSISSQSGIQLNQLPLELQTICKQIETLDLQNETNNHPTIQSIVYHYPNIKIHFNCPMNYHSAQFVIDARVDPTGNLTSVEFEGRFFAPENWLAMKNRENSIMTLALDSYYSEDGPHLKRPENYKLSPPQSGAAQFKWKIALPISSEEGLNDLEHVSSYLQQMINYLQKPIQEKDLSSRLITEDSQLFEDYPWALDLMSENYFLGKLFFNGQTDITYAVLNGTLKNPDEKNISALLANYYKLLKSNININSRLAKLFEQVIDLLIDQKSIWKSPEKRLRLAKFFLALNPKAYEKATSNDKYYEKALALKNLFTTERVKKIQEYIPLIRDDASQNHYQAYEKQSLQQFISLFEKA